MVLFAAMHGILVIPVLLSILGPDTLPFCKQRSSVTLHPDAGARKTRSSLGALGDPLGGRLGPRDAEPQRHDPEGCSNEDLSIVESDQRTVNSELSNSEISNSELSKEQSEDGSAITVDEDTSAEEGQEQEASSGSGGASFPRGHV